MRLHALALAFALATLTMPALAGPGDHSPGQGRMDHDSHMDRMADRWDHMDPAKRDALMTRAESRGMFARLTYDNATGNVGGRFVSFHLAAQDGAIHQVRTIERGNATLWFTGVTPSSFTLDEVRATGSVLNVRGANLTLMAHNNPTGGLHYRASAAVTLTFELSANATIGPNATRELQVRANGLHGHILTNGNHSITVSGKTVTVRLDAGDSAMFRAHPMSQEPAMLHGENRAFKERLMGASVRIAGDNGTALVDDTSETVEVEPGMVRRGRAEINISSEHSGAQVLFFTIDGETLSPRNARNLSVELSGEKAVLLPTVDGVLSAPGLAAFLQGDQAAGTVQVALRVPHFSSYTLAIADLSVAQGGQTTSPASATSPSAGAPGASGTTASKGSPGLAAGMVLASLAAVALALRRQA